MGSRLLSTAGCSSFWESSVTTGKAPDEPRVNKPR